MLDLRTTPTPGAGLLAASAVRTGSGVRFSWSIARKVPGLRFEIVRRSGATTTLLARVPGRNANRYSYLWRDARLDPAARYFLTARTPGGNWESAGPLTPD